MDVEILPNNRPAAASPTHTASQQQHVLLPGQSEVSNGSRPALGETDFAPFHMVAEENDESSEQRAATCVCVWEGWLADTLLYYVYSKRSNGAAGWLQENRWLMRKHRHFRDSTRSDTHLCRLLNPVYWSLCQTTEIHSCCVVPGAFKDTQGRTWEQNQINID